MHDLFKCALRNTVSESGPVKIMVTLYNTDALISINSCLTNAQIILN